MEPHRGRRLPVTLEHPEVEAHLDDAVGQRLVEVLERSDEEGVLALGARAHVTRHAALTAVVGENSARGRELEADVVDVHHALAVNAAPSGPT